VPLVALHNAKGEFIAHILPPLDAKTPDQRTPLTDAEIEEAVKKWELNTKLESYCSHVGGYCEGLFRILDTKHKRVPRSHGFMITVPYSYKDQTVQQQAIHITAMSENPTT